MVAEVTGDGFPIVMIHGLGGSSNTFQPQMSELSEFRVIRPDLPGSGLSPAPVNILSIDYFSNAVRSLLKSLNIGRAHMVGHSLGTLVCQRLAVDEPEIVASLTLFGALTEPSDVAREGLLARAKKVRLDGMGEVADQVITNTLSSSTHDSKPEAVAFVRETLMRQNPEGYAKTCEALSKARTVDWRRIFAPTLLVTGDNDPVAPVSMAQILEKNLANASLTVLENCGHWATIEKAKESNQKLLAFLRKSDQNSVSG